MIGLIITILGTIGVGILVILAEHKEEIWGKILYREKGDKE